MSEQSQTAATILVVDDNPLIANVLKSLLQASKYEVCVANNGEEALDTLNKQEIDVIVCDVMMPRMDGYALHEIVRQRSELSHIPFIFLSALSDNVEINRGRESGADDYLTKPFDPRAMLSIIKGKVARSRTLKQQAVQKYEAYRKRVVHTLSHEFRTPLVAINTGTELLLDHKSSLQPEKAHTLLEAVRRGGQRLERLVTDFMILQQLDIGAGQKLFEARAKAESIGKLTERYLEIYGDVIPKASFTMSFQDNSNGARARVYEPHMVDILGRLVSNVLKFAGDDKTLEIEVLTRPNEVVIEMRDRGVGIDLSRLREALSLFGQIDRDKNEQQGSGVGLTIAARLAKVQGGGLEFERREGGGTVVRVVLPEYKTESEIAANPET